GRSTGQRSPSATVRDTEPTMLSPPRRTATSASDTAATDMPPSLSLRAGRHGPRPPEAPWARAAVQAGAVPDPRRSAQRAPRPVLPRPGRTAALVGPPSALPAAIEAEQAVVVTAAGIADHTLVPEIEPVADRGRRGFEVSWSRFDAPLGQHVAPAAAGGARE